MTPIPEDREHRCERFKRRTIMNRRVPKKSQGISQAAQWTTNIHGINKNTIFRVILKDGFNG